MIKPPLVAISLIGIIAMSPLGAGAADVNTTVDQEAVRRVALANLANDEIKQGDKQYEAKNYDVAVQMYKLACDQLAESPETHSERARALEGFGKASVRLAEQRITEGRYADAKAALKSDNNKSNAILDPGYDPTYKPAIETLAHMEDAEWFNTTRGPIFEDKVHQVEKLFIEARGFYNTGRYDLALKRYDQILDIDPYNKAAREGQEVVLKAKSDYANEAYNETRSMLLWQVTKEWETAPRKYINRQVLRIETPANTNNTEYIQNKLNHIVIPTLHFQDAAVRDVIDWLRQKSVQLDTMESNPARRGVSIVLKLNENPSFGAPPPGAGPGAGALPPPALAPAGVAVPVPVAPTASLGDKKITLSLTNIPLSEALRYVCELAELKTKVEPYAVLVVPLSEPTTTLSTKEYRVPPGFLNTTGPAGPSLLTTPPLGAPGAAGPGLAAPAPATPTALHERLTALEYLKNNGVEFGEGASAQFLPSSSKLVVRNTDEQLDLVDQIVDALNNAQPTQVSVESKFVEIEQSNYKELSFDYSLGTGNLGKIQYSGGNTIAPTTTFPFTNIFGGGEIGTGLRSGNQAVTGDSIDELLTQSTTPPGQASPATFALAGVVTSAQFQAIVRALNQKTGVDLLSAPSVTTKSGQRAVVEVVVEFRYPTEFNPPQVPNIVAGPGGVVIGGGGGAGGAGAAAPGYTPVTPTTPTGFETRNTGVTLEVQPVVGSDGETIDLDLSPQVVEFDGFVNYGSPIYGPPLPIISPIFPFPVIGYGPPTVVTNNVINQPIFDTRKVTTSVTVWDGQTVIIGGLVREDVQTVNDKVPGLGDLPIIGRFFRSNVDQHIKRNLVMFVTAHLMNPAGELVHEEEEKEEEVTPLGPPELPVTPSLPEVPLGGGKGADDK